MDCAIMPGCMAQAQNQPSHDRQWNQTKDAKGAVEKPPAKRDAADRAANQRQWNDQQTGNHAKLNHPDVPDRILQRSPKSNGDHEMGERQPVGAIRQKGILAARGLQTLTNIRQPMRQSRKRVPTAVPSPNQDSAAAIPSTAETR